MMLNVVLVIYTEFKHVASAQGPRMARKYYLAT